MGREKYSHTKLCPLDDPSKELRILEIIDNDSKIVEAHLTKHQDGQKYGTLSWCWGTRGKDDEDEEIRIIQSNQSYKFSVLPNLARAIEALRHHGHHRVWIDYICVDQSSIKEKNFQIPLMASIYREAECVFVWLGSEGENSKVAMDFIKNDVLNLRGFDRLIRDNNKAKEWQALSALMKRRWFTRRWIIQEIAVAQRAVILCGMEKVAWNDLADVISLFNEVETARNVSEIMKNVKELGHIPDFFGNASESSATKLVEETNNLFRKSSGGDQQAQFNLEYLVSKLTTFDATEPRDTIYALLAIAKDTVPVTTRPEKDTVQKWTRNNEIKERLIEQLSRSDTPKPYNVDYELPLSDVYVQFVQWAINRSGKSHALDIICRPWAPIPKSSTESDTDDADMDDEEEEVQDTPWCLKTGKSRPRGEIEDTLPSWIPTLARAAFGMDGTGQRMTRKNADSLVGLPPKRVYTAAGSRVLTKNFRFENGVTLAALNGTSKKRLHYHSMFVEGFILDKVKDVKDSSQQGNIPKSWMRWSRQKKPTTTSDLADGFWRTLVVDRGPNGENTPRYYPRLVRHALETGVPGETLNTKDVVNWGNCRIVGEVLQRVQSAIWNRSMIRTKQGKRLGLTPDDTKQGDLICILYGCSVPVVLREFKKSKEEVEEQNRQRQRKREAEAAKKMTQYWQRVLDARKAAPSTSIAQAERETLRREKTEPTTSSVEVSIKPLTSDPYTFYQLIGECYVDGMMNGEALLQPESQSSTLFEIR
ncbi:HET-domain-containing protein [Daldinia eschscholtzii]|nr:HET-domain-containing protein [Daldinia eschscholtzii]